MTPQTPSKPDIRAFIFDYGNLLMSFDYNLFLAKIEPFTPLSIDQLHRKIYSPGTLNEQFELGHLTGREFFEAVEKECQLRRISQPQFREAYSRIMTPLPRSYALVEELAGQGYALGLLSNTSPWIYDDNIRIMPIFPQFQAISVSFKVGHKKPAEEIFHDQLDQLGLPPEEYIYLDDLQDYVDAANRLGFKAYEFNPAENPAAYTVLGKELKRDLGIRLETLGTK
ncbi:hypothetical protein CMO92_02550 [Candidatus Woesearchaeota archaeon]|nr:hypothetical protein [Candidatus Woesearchaeota archaeon]|tara:strand:- start:129 stop:806 length:678 start_codon:yes stop_codon:yes gene_type:complete